MQLVNKNNNVQADFSDIEKDYSQLSPYGKQLLKITISTLLAIYPIERPKLAVVKKTSS